MPKAEVPNLRALGVTNVRKAEDILEAAGFVLGPVSVTADNDRDPGVSAQVPRGGSQAEIGAAVSFRLNEPTVTPDAGTVPMPDLSSALDPDDAELMLRASGINFDRRQSFGYTPSGYAKDTFVGQRPLAGRPVSVDNPSIKVTFADPDLLERQRPVRMRSRIERPQEPSRAAKLGKGVRDFLFTAK